MGPRLITLFSCQPLDLWCTVHACTFAESERSHRILANDLVELVPPHHRFPDNILLLFTHIPCLFNPVGTHLMLLRPTSNNQGIRSHKNLKFSSDSQLYNLEVGIFEQVPFQ